MYLLSFALGVRRDTVKSLSFLSRLWCVRFLTVRTNGGTNHCTNFG